MANKKPQENRSYASKQSMENNRYRALGDPEELHSIYKRSNER